MSDELFDIVDDNDRVIGQAPRSIAHQQGLQHRGVHALLFTREGKALVQTRSKSRAQSPSLMDCSVSEHVKAGEDYDEAIARGLLEELGLENVDLQPLITFRLNYGPNDNEISRIYRGGVDPSQVRFDPVEIERVDYFDMKSLSDLAQENPAVFTRWFIQIIRWFIGSPSELIILP